MAFDLNHSIEVLRKTPSVLHSLLSGLSDEWTFSNYGENTFSPFDVIGHLLHGERTDWMPRLRIILEHGDSQPFESFDRYAMHEESRDKSLDELLQAFAELRKQNLDELVALKLTAKQLNRRGLHPALGTVTLQQLLATWVVHDLNHLHQIAKSMAYQYRNEMGPWRQYMTFLPPDA
jgi:DinB superfamily